MKMVVFISLVLVLVVQFCNGQGPICVLPRNYGRPGIRARTIILTCPAGGVLRPLNTRSAAFTCGRNWPNQYTLCYNGRNGYVPRIAIRRPRASPIRGSTSSGGNSASSAILGVILAQLILNRQQEEDPAPSCSTRVSLGAEDGGTLPDAAFGPPNAFVSGQPEFGRLNYNDGGTKGWRFLFSFLPLSFLEVNLQTTRLVERVITQGGNNDKFARLYKLSYSTDGTNFQFVKESNGIADRIFTGNTDEDTEVPNTLSPAILASHVRFHPTRGNLPGDDAVRMRVNLEGCSPPDS